MLRLLFTFALVSWIGCGQSTLPRLFSPRLGVVRLNDGSVRPVFGGPGSFVLGDPVFNGVKSASFSDTAGIVAFADRLAILDHELNVLREEPMESAATVHIDTDARSAIAWIAKSSELLFWDGTGLARVRVQGMPEGAVWSLSRNGSQAVLLLQQLRVSVSLETGDVTDCRAVTEGNAAAFAQATGQNPGDITAEQMSDSYVHVSSLTDSRTWVVSTIGKGGIWELPAAKRVE